MSKRHVIFVVIVLAVFSSLIGFNAIKSFLISKFLKEHKFPAPTVSTAVSKSEEWTPTLEVVGTIVAINGVDLNTETSGTITKIYFSSGQYIEEGAPLLDIDDSVEVAQLQNYQAKLELTTTTFKRQEDLLKKGATSSSDYDTAKANKKEAQANIQKTKAQIKQKHLTAPFSGKLGINTTNVGQYISPGENIVSLQSLDPLYIQFYLPGHRINQINVGQTILFSTDAVPNYLFRGKITAINSEINTDTNNILIEATVSNCSEKGLKTKNKQLVSQTTIKGYNSPITLCNSEENLKQNVTDYVLLPGLFTNVQVLLPNLPNAVVVPESAISYSLYGNSIYVVNKSKDGKTQTVQRTFVKTGDQRDGRVVVLKGIKAGDEVVNSGQLKLNNGMEIKINNSVKLNNTTPINKLVE